MRGVRQQVDPRALWAVDHGVTDHHGHGLTDCRLLRYLSVLLRVPGSARSREHMTLIWWYFCHCDEVATGLTLTSRWFCRTNGGRRWIRQRK